MNDSAKLTKAQRKEAARAAAAELKAKQAAAERRTKRIIFGSLAAVVAVLVALVVFLMVRGDGNFAIPSTDRSIPLADVENTPRTARADGGIVVGAGGVAGAAEVPDAPEVGIFLDYRCPACDSFERINLGNLRAFMDGDDANLVMYPVAILDQGNSTDSQRIAAASAWIADRAPAQWFDFHLAIFELTTGNNPRNSELADAAAALGVPSEVAEAIRTGEAHATFGQWAASASGEFLTRDGFESPTTGQRGTPTISLDGVRWNGDWGDPASLASAVVSAESPDAGE